jgi:uncharacterized Zn finger protein (UPF0148 family)
MEKKAVLCPHCGNECEHLGTKIPVPQKSDTRGWEDLRNFLSTLKQERAALLSMQRANRVRHLRKQIEKLSSLQANPGRATEIQKLRHELDELNE